MTDESDEQIAEKIRSRYEKLFNGTLKLTVVDGVNLGGRPYEEWHDEILERIDEIRKINDISVEEAGKKICEPYLQKYNVSFDGFTAAYWRRKRERSEERFMRAVANRDMPAAVFSYKQLSERSKEKLGLN